MTAVDGLAAAAAARLLDDLVAAVPADVAARFLAEAPAAAHPRRRVGDLLHDPAHHGTALFDGVGTDLVADAARFDHSIARVVLRFEPDGPAVLDGLPPAPATLRTTVTGASLSGTSHLGRATTEVSLLPQVTVAPGSTGPASQFAGTQAGGDPGVHAGALSGQARLGRHPRALDERRVGLQPDRAARVIGRARGLDLARAPVAAPRRGAPARAAARLGARRAPGHRARRVGRRGPAERAPAPGSAEPGAPRRPTRRPRAHPGRTAPRRPSRWPAGVRCARRCGPPSAPWCPTTSPPCWTPTAGSTT
nr:hypothetical protein [Angustibacter aerolatus]